MRDKIRVQYRQAEHRQVHLYENKHEQHTTDDKVIADLLPPVEIPYRYCQQYLKRHNEPHHG